MEVILQSKRLWKFIWVSKGVLRGNPLTKSEMHTITISDWAIWSLEMGPRRPDFVDFCWLVKHIDSVECIAFLRCRRRSGTCSNIIWGCKGAVDASCLVSKRSQWKREWKYSRILTGYWYSSVNSNALWTRCLVQWVSVCWCKACQWALSWQNGPS